MKEAVIVQQAPTFSLGIQRECCGDPIRAFDVLRDRVRDYALKPLPHKSKCLKEEPKLYGLFGSVLKGTYVEGSDVDYAVYMTRTPLQDAKKVLDKAYFAIKTAYGLVVYGEVEKVPVDLYFVNPDTTFHAFYIDGLYACELTDEKRQRVQEWKRVGKAIGAYGEFGGVPGIALETMAVRNLGADAFRWHYLPIKGMEAAQAGNAFGRTFYVNQMLYYDVVSGLAPQSDPVNAYVTWVEQYAEKNGYTYEYVLARETLPLYLVYDAYVTALTTTLGRERALYTGKFMGLFGNIDGTYVMGLLGVKTGKVVGNTEYAAAIDRVHMLLPEYCSIFRERGYNFEGGIVCAEDRLQIVPLREVVKAMYARYRVFLGDRYDKLVTSRII